MHEAILRGDIYACFIVSKPCKYLFELTTSFLGVLTIIISSSILISCIAITLVSHYCEKWRREEVAQIYDDGVLFLLSLTSILLSLSF